MSIGIIIGIVLAIFTLITLGGAAISFQKHSKTGVKLCGAIAIVLIIAIAIVPYSIKTVESGEIAVVKTLGKVHDEERTAGTHFDFWITNSYTVYDTKVQTVDLVFSAYSADAQTMDVTMTLQYQIIPDRASDIVTQYGALETLQNRITSLSTAKAKSVLSIDKAMDIIANRAQMSPAVENAIKDAIGENYYVNVVTVVLTDITFTDAFELAVEEKMIAEQAKLKAEYENQTKVAQAEAEAEAKLKAAEAEIQIAEAQAEAKLKAAEAQIEIAKAEAEAKKVAAEAEAEANKIVSESITPEIIEKTMAESWDGKLPSVVAGSDSGLGMILPEYGK